MQEQDTAITQKFKEFLASPVEEHLSSMDLVFFDKGKLAPIYKMGDEFCFIFLPHCVALDEGGNYSVAYEYTPEEVETLNQYGKLLASKAEQTFKTRFLESF